MSRTFFYYYTQVPLIHAGPAGPGVVQVSHK